MTRLPDKRKESGKHGERDTCSKGDKTGHIVAGSSDVGRGIRHRTLTTSKATRLPPLKSQRLPDLHSRHASDNVPLLQSAKPDFDLYSMGYAPMHTSVLKPYILPDTNDKACNKSKAKDKHQIRHETDIAKSIDVSVNIKRNEYQQTDGIQPHPPPAIKDTRTTLTTRHPVKWYGVDKEVTWQNERELLRKHRQQQAQRMNQSGKPIKATMTFDSSGREKKRSQEYEMAGKKSSTNERKKIDLSVRRKCDDAEDWDWEKDIEEYLEIEEKERTNKRTISVSGISSPVQCGGHREKTPVILDCTKKGVGFKSKRKIEEERRQEQERIEKERKEKEKIELMIPQKIRKDFKKYGFR